jgi:hypothetical protein
VPWANKSWREQLGNAAWHFIHTVAGMCVCVGMILLMCRTARYPDKPTIDFQNAAHDLMRSLQFLYPCDECRNHLNRCARHAVCECRISATPPPPPPCPLRNLRRVPGLWPPTVSSREQFSQWVCKVGCVTRASTHTSTYTPPPPPLSTRHA